MLYYSCRVIIYHTNTPRQHIFLFYGILFLNFQFPCLIPGLYEKKQSTHSYAPLLFICFFKFRCSCCEIITKVSNQSLFLSIAEANGFFKKSFMLLTTSLKSTLLKLIFFAKVCHFFCISGSVPNCIACSNCFFVNL